MSTIELYAAAAIVIAIVSLLIGLLVGWKLRGFASGNAQFVTKKQHAQDMADVQHCFKVVEQHVVALKREIEGGGIDKLGRMAEEFGKMMGVPKDKAAEDRPPHTNERPM